MFLPPVVIANGTLMDCKRRARVEYLIAHTKRVRAIQVPQPAISSSCQEIHAVVLAPFSMISLPIFFLVWICSSHAPESIMHQHLWFLCKSAVENLISDARMTLKPAQQMSAALRQITRVQRASFIISYPSRNKTGFCRRPIHTGRERKTKSLMDTHTASAVWSDQTHPSPRYLTVDVPQK